MYFRLCFLSCAVVFILLNGCVTTNYYTGRTLDDGEVVLTPGVDNLVIVENEDGIVQKDLSFSISFGIARGFPWRFEAGIRTYFPYVYEANLRHQINPRSFTWFDISANFHGGVILDIEEPMETTNPYFKYGLTISREIFGTQPYFSYYLVKNALLGELSDNFDFEKTYCAGWALPYSGDLIFPEINYFAGDGVRKGFFTFGIGVRAKLDKAEKPKER